MPIITIANQKGGVGKTTTAVTIAHGLALLGKDVLIIDLDPQGQCSTLLGMKQEPGIFGVLIQELPLKMWTRYTNREHLWLVPGNNKSALAATIMSVTSTTISKLKDILRPVLRSGLQYVIVDTAPSVGDLQAQGLYAADHILIPTACDFASSQGVVKLIQTMSILAEEHHWTGTLIGILPTFYDGQTRETKATLEDLNTNFPNILPPIHRATILRECMANGKTIFELAPRDRAAEEYQTIIKYIQKVTR